MHLVVDIEGLLLAESGVPFGFSDELQLFPSQQTAY